VLFAARSHGDGSELVKRKTRRCQCSVRLFHEASKSHDGDLAASLPLATGVIEGACRHLVKDRLERTGMRWSASGAQAMLSLRCLKGSSDRDEFQQQFLNPTPLKA